jgi:small subunit ribosomal protein S16
MLKIRLQRTGRNNEKTFRLVLTDSKNSTKSGRFLEVLGNHDFRNSNTAINAERVNYLISKGAKTTNTVHNLLLANKVITGKKINVLPRKSPPKKEEAPVEKKAAAPAAPAVAAAPTPSETPAA